MGSTQVSKLRPATVWQWEHWRKGVLLGAWEKENMIPDAAIDGFLDDYYYDGTFYLLTYESNTTPAAAMTYAVPVFTECTAISESTRPLWSSGAVSGQEISNYASKATFTYSSGKTIYGGGMVTGGTAPSTKGDTAGGGLLAHVAAFGDGSRVVAASDVLQIGVKIIGADG